MASPARILMSKRRRTHHVSFAALLVIFLWASPAVAKIDLGGALKRAKEGKDGPSGANKENSGSKCDEIMAKNLVAANEAKAAVEAARDAAVQAAAELEKEAEELAAQLAAKGEEVAALEGQVAEAKAAAASKLVEETEKLKLQLDAMKNATSQSMEKLEAEHKKALAAKDDEIAQKDYDIEALMSDKEWYAAEAEKQADEKIASITAAADQARREMADANQRKIDETLAEVKKEKDALESTLAGERGEHAEKLAALKEEHAETLKKEREETEAKIKEARDEMESAVRKATDKLEGERASFKEWEAGYKQRADEAREREYDLEQSLKKAGATTSQLEQDVAVWAKLHDSQSYCNVTLLKEDGKQFVVNFSGNVAVGLDTLHAELVDLLKSGYGRVTLFVEDEVLPSIRMVVTGAQEKAGPLIDTTLEKAGEAMDATQEKAGELYDAHLAPVVNDKLVPVYNERVLPIYNEKILPVYTDHVSPVVKKIEGEAAVVLEKSKKEAQKARGEAAKLVKQGSSSALGVMKEKNLSSKLPAWFVDVVYESSKDGEWAVDILIKGLLVLLAYLCRGLIYWFVSTAFSIVWFFCPLRLFFGGRRKTDTKAARAAKGAKMNGKAKVH
ncbi:hypothetical protein ACHAXT_011152 [Thalassiosira profunda]